MSSLGMTSKLWRVLINWHNTLETILEACTVRAHKLVILCPAEETCLVYRDQIIQPLVPAEIAHLLMLQLRTGTFRQI
jgi:hypothetical protein